MEEFTIIIHFAAPPDLSDNFEILLHSSQRTSLLNRKNLVTDQWNSGKTPKPQAENDPPIRELGKSRKGRCSHYWMSSERVDYSRAKFDLMSSSDHCRNIGHYITLEQTFVHP